MVPESPGEVVVEVASNWRAFGVGVDGTGVEVAEDVKSAKQEDTGITSTQHLVTGTHRL